MEVNTPLVDGVAPDLEMDCMAYGMGGCAKSHAPTRTRGSIGYNTYIYIYMYIVIYVTEYIYMIDIYTGIYIYKHIYIYIYIFF